MTKEQLDKLSSPAKLIAAARWIIEEGKDAEYTVRGVASRAGVNHGLVHHYFKSMEGLSLALFDEFAEELLERLMANLPENPDQATFLRSLGENLTREKSTARFFIAFATLSQQMPKLKARMAEVAAQRREMMKKLLGMEAMETLTLFQAVLFGSLFMAQVDPGVSPAHLLEYLNRHLQVNP